MKTKHKVLAASTFAKMFNHGRKQFVDYDETTKTITLMPLGGTGKKSMVSLCSAGVHERYAQALYGEDETGGAAIHHGNTYETEACDLIEQGYGEDWELVRQFRITAAGRDGNFVSKLAVSSVADLVACQEGVAREVIEIKCPHAKGKALAALRFLNLDEDKAQSLIKVDPTWYGQLQFYMHAMGDIPGYIAVYEPRIENGLVIVKIPNDEGVAKLIDDVVPIVNKELVQVGEDFANLALVPKVKVDVDEDEMIGIEEAGIEEAGTVSHTIDDRKYF